MRKVSLVVSISLLACLAACGKSPEERAAGAALSAITGSEVAVEENGDKVTFGEGDKAMTISSGDSARLPASFPKDVYLPDDYEIDSVVDSAGFTMVSVRIDGKLSAASEAARQRMLDAGWKQSMAATDDDTNHLLAYENDDRTALMSFSTDSGDGVVYSVQLSQKRQ
ncbi:MAG: hypothetical protein M3Y70_04200 [Pseudomonadota bacterium]|nr:hypothetical protein [Pseudomonadota bacterium]